MARNEGEWPPRVSAEARRRGLREETELEREEWSAAGGGLSFEQELRQSAGWERSSSFSSSDGLGGFGWKSTEDLSSFFAGADARRKFAFSTEGRATERVYTLIIRKQFKEASRFLRALIDERNKELQKMRSLPPLQSADLQREEEDLGTRDASLQVEPSENLLALLAWCLYMQKDFEQAAEVYGQLHRLRPDSLDYEVGRAPLGAGDFSAQEESARQAFVLRCTQRTLPSAVASARPRGS